MLTRIAILRREKRIACVVARETALLYHSSQLPWRFSMRMSVRMFSVFILANVLLSNMPGAAQVVTVDATPSHVVNRFSPLRALGSTVDRVPSNEIGRAHV